MTKVYLALGSNVGDSRAHISKAIELLKPYVEDIKTAPLYRSKAAGYTDQPDFLNTAAVGETKLEPHELLKALKDIEQQIGRTTTFHWGPREIDIDIIFYGDTVLDSPELTIPHDAFRERAFVLQPLVDLEPELVDPASGLSVSLLLKALPPEEVAALQQVNP